MENPPRIYGDDLALISTAKGSAAGLPRLAFGGGVTASEMARTFNCGIGILIFVSADTADACLAALRDGPEPDAWVVGQLGARGDGPAVTFSDQSHWSQTGGQPS